MNADQPPTNSHTTKRANGDPAPQTSAARTTTTATLEARAQTLPARAAEMLLLSGMLLYAVAAPHSIAVAWVGLAVSVLGWLLRVVSTGQTGLRRTAFDVPIWLFFGWTLLSVLFSAEPRISLSKLPSVSTFLVFYLAQAALTRRRVLVLSAVLIASGVAGVLWGIGDVARGRGVVLEEIAASSPFRAEGLQVQTGDAIWRVGARRVASVEEIDEALRATPLGERPAIHLISQGEHVVREGPVVTEALKAEASPSGLRGTARTHRFRASGWTRHYETFAETLQILAQLALGFALAWLSRQSKAEESRPQESRRSVALAGVAFVLLGTGIALTAMRTVLVAFAIGACVVVWRAATRARTRFAISVVILLTLLLGAFAVWQTRPAGALRLKDDSAALRSSVAQHALERVPVHPVFGHGMDAVNLHWQEWGFPGTEHIHTHSTWVQLAFDRGVPALLIWLWIIVTFWLMLLRGERIWRDSENAGAHGFVLGAAGALAGFTASSLVNYNFGDSEIALLIWWLMGALVALMRDE